MKTVAPCLWLAALGCAMLLPTASHARGYSPQGVGGDAARLDIGSPAGT